MSTYNQKFAIDTIEAIGPRRASPVTAVDLSMDAATGGESAPIPLGQRMLEAYAQSSVSLKGDRLQTMDNLEKIPGNPNRTEGLAETQQRIGDYALQTSLASGLVRKGVAAVETLLRA